MRPGSIAKISTVGLVVLLGSCRSSPPRAPVKGEAYVGPATLNLRSDFPTQSSTVATVKHGDRLEIVDQHRLFVKVRTANGAEGWIEQRQLLGADDMAALKALAKRAATMPSQGRATTDADLRVHIQPAAASPSFLTLKENDKVDVLTHLRAPAHGSAAQAAGASAAEEGQGYAKQVRQSSADSSAAHARAAPAAGELAGAFEERRTGRRARRRRRPRRRPRPPTIGAWCGARRTSPAGC